MVAVVPYDYLMNLLEAWEDAIDSNLLKMMWLVMMNSSALEDAIEAHNSAHNVEVLVVRHALVKTSN